MKRCLAWKIAMFHKPAILPFWASWSAGEDVKICTFTSSQDPPVCCRTTIWSLHSGLTVRTHHKEVPLWNFPKSDLGWRPSLEPDEQNKVFNNQIWWYLPFSDKPMDSSVNYRLNHLRLLAPNSQMVKSRIWVFHEPNLHHVCFKIPNLG